MRKKIPVIVGIVVLTMMLWLIVSIEFTSWDFRNNLWAPTHLLWRGESAYDIRSVFPNGNAIWFPQIVGVFFPLGMMPLRLATGVWLAMSVVALVAMTWYLSWQVAQQKPNPWAFGVLSLTVLLFVPTIRHLILGQADLILIVTMVAGVYALERDRLALSALLFAIALAKPQLCIIVLPTAIVHFLLLHGRWWGALKLLVLIGIFAFLLTFPLWLGSSHWISDLLSNLNKNPQWLQPALFSQLSVRAGSFGLALWCLILLSCLVLSIRVWSKLGPTRGVLWSMALTTIASPYLWSWDFVLILPLFIDTAVRLANSVARVTLFAFWAACSILLFLSSGASDSGSWWLPLVMILGVVLSLQLSKKKGERSANGSAPT